MYSKHYIKGRKKRQNYIDKYMNGDGNVLLKCYLDKGHKKGAEIHCLTDNGIIIVYNAITHKMVTKLVARPEQIETLYRIKKQTAPSYLLNLASWHETCGYNYL